MQILPRMFAEHYWIFLNFSLKAVFFFLFLLSVPFLIYFSDGMLFWAGNLFFNVYKLELFL